MPQIPVNLGNVEAFTNLPLGEYLGEISAMKFREATEPGKSPQIMVTYSVIDGVKLGKTQSQFISLSPNALFRAKRWFMNFGLGDLPALDVDDDTNDVLDPDLVGVRVIFKVYEDPKLYKGEKQVRTELVSVEDDMSAAPAQAAAPAPARAPRPAPAPAAAAPDPAVEAARLAQEKRAARMAAAAEALRAAQAAAEAAAAEDDEDGEEEAAPAAEDAPAPRRRPTPPAPVEPAEGQARPQRRTLR